MYRSTWNKIHGEEANIIDTYTVKQTYNTVFWAKIFYTINQKKLYSEIRGTEWRSLPVIRIIPCKEKNVCEKETLELKKRDNIYDEICI